MDPFDALDELWERWTTGPRPIDSTTARAALADLLTDTYPQLRELLRAAKEMSRLFPYNSHSKPIRLLTETLATYEAALTEQLPPTTGDEDSGTA